MQRFHPGRKSKLFAPFGPRKFKPNDPSKLCNPKALPESQSEDSGPVTAQQYTIPISERKDPPFPSHRVLTNDLITQIIDKAQELKSQTTPCQPRISDEHLAKILGAPKIPVRGSDKHVRRQAAAIKHKIEQHNLPVMNDPTKVFWSKLAATPRWRELDPILFI